MLERRTILLGAAAMGAMAMGGCATDAGVTQASAPDAARISVVTQGAGPDVILVPGMTSSREIWTATAAALESTHRLHLVQVGGFAGASVGGNGEGIVAAPVAEEIARYIAAENLAAPAIIGHSMGGAISLMVAARHPQAVSRVMVVDMLPFTGMLFGGTDAASVRPIADQLRDQVIAAGGGNSPFMQQMIGGMVATVSARPMVLRHARASDTGVVARSFHELITTDLRPELAAIVAPTIVLYVTPRGAPLSDAEIDGIYQDSYTNLRGVTLKRVADARHFIMLDAPSAFIADVQAFLA